MRSTECYNKQIEVFDLLCGAKYKYAEKGRTTKYLRALAHKMWEECGRKDHGCPRITFSQTVSPKRGVYENWCEGRRWINISIRTQNISTLLHELTHALGYYFHSEGFVRKYAQLMARYGHCDYEKLMVLARKAGTIS